MSDSISRQEFAKDTNVLTKDLISRQDAIDTIRKFQTYKLFEKDNMLLVDQAEVMTELMMLPSAEPQWIPVSERLPERNEIVLVSYKTTNKVHMCKYLDDGSENPWWSYNDDCSAWNNVILAWMPLPPPYEGGETV